jgi:PAS domain S-box-containing protein
VVAAAANFIFLNSIAGVSSAFLIQGLQAIAEKERTLSKDLAEEKALLVEAKKSLEDEIFSRIEAEKRLRNSEKRYRLLAENVTDVLWTFSMVISRFTFVSPSVQGVRGFSPEEAMGLSLEQTLAPSSLELVTAVLAEELARDGQKGVDPNRSRTLEIEQVSKNGTFVWGEATITFLRNEEGKPIGMLGITRDIRERKAAQEEKRKLENRLMEARKMEAIATLAGGVAHEYNNALNIIALSLDGMTADMPADPALGSYVTCMKRSVERMSLLTEQLLAYARGGKYRVSRIPMKKLVETTLPLVRHAVQPSVRLQTDVPENLWTVDVDATQIQMVLHAVLSNASEAIEGEGSVWISCRNLEVREGEDKTESELQHGCYVCLTVKDDGKGMGEETRTKIFEPFFTTKFQGRGLGMSAVYGIVKKHGGSISIDSTPGKGTTVRICLPAVEKRMKKNIAHEEAGTRMKTLLLIEDEEILSQLVRTVLERFGYWVLEARSGQEAVSIASSYEEEIHLAVMDMVLPDLDSRELFQTLKNVRPNMKVLLVSGYALDGPAQELLVAGAQAFLPKAFTIEALLGKLREMGGILCPPAGKPTPYEIIAGPEQAP